MTPWGWMRNPIWSEFGRLQRGLDDLARQMTAVNRSSFEPWFGSARIFPFLNVVRTNNEFVVTAEIPGMNTDDLDIKVESDTLTIKGERKPQQPEIGVSYHRKERASGTFQRSLTLPSSVESGEVKANYADGILTITLPIQKAARPKQIDVKTS